MMIVSKFEFLLDLDLQKHALYIGDIKDKISKQEKNNFVNF